MAFRLWHSMVPAHPHGLLLSHRRKFQFELRHCWRKGLNIIVTITTRHMSTPVLLVLSSYQKRIFLVIPSSIPKKCSLLASFSFASLVDNLLTWCFSTGFQQILQVQFFSASPRILYKTAYIMFLCLTHQESEVVVATISKNPMNNMIMWH